MIPDQWYAILPSKAVKKGKITGVTRLNLRLAVFRDSEGKPGCVADRCTHRGAALSIGKVKGNCLQCPFHGLEFDAEGKCCFIPANGKSSKADISRYNVHSYAVREKYGIIYLWYGDADKATDELPFFSEDIDETWIYSEMEDHWNAHYSRCIENQLDVVHLPFVHYNTIGRGNRTIVNGPKIEDAGGGFITSANNETDEGQTPKKADDCVIKSTYLRFMYPNIWLNHIADKIKVMIYFAPVDDENTILYIRFYGRVTGFRPADAFIAWIGKFMNRVIERQDKRVVITQQPKASALRSDEKLVAGDSPIVKYRQGREERKKRAAVRPEPIN